MTQMYYTTNHLPTLNISTQIIPTPQISLSTDIDYASENNNILVGHKYTMTLTGTATAYREIPNDPENQALVLRNVSNNINQIRKLLSQMGNTLYIRKNNVDILVATGGKLVSFQITESDNNWKTFANYTAQIEFQSVDYNGDDYSCEYNIFNIQDQSCVSSGVVDISKYKIKEFNENYEISLVDGLYNRIRKIDTDKDLSIENLFINFTYDISAVGKHFFVEDKLLPAWEQAKNFVQDKLYNKINNLGSVLGIRASGACEAVDDLTQIQRVPFDGSGLLEDIYPQYYSVFNEEVSCNTSESDGSFSALYKCIIKRTKSGTEDIEKYAKNSIHTFTKDIQYAIASTKNTTISIDGNIQGLNPGGLVLANTSGFFRLPNQGNLVVIGSGTYNIKYDNALATLNLLLNNDYTDLSNNFKTDIGITASGLDIDQIPMYGLDSQSNPVCTGVGSIIASSINLTHNPFEGIITYNIQYNSNHCYGTEFTSASISVENPTQVFATFVIPGAETTSNIGTVLQNIGTITSKVIDVTIQGVNINNKFCGLTNNNVNSIYNNICNDITLPPSIANRLPDPDKYILKTKNKTTNLNDGSYTINLGYICNSGCFI
jgi:hypothetical protein